MMHITPSTLPPGVLRQLLPGGGDLGSAGARRRALVASAPLVEELQSGLETGRHALRSKTLGDFEGDVVGISWGHYMFVIA